MVGSNDDITYSGPSLRWNPQRSVGEMRPTVGYRDTSGTYADLDILLRNLDFLKSLTEDTIKACEQKLQDYNLLIKVKTELENAQKSEWPSELGGHKNYITYSQYKVMRLRESAGSSYIAKEYENALRSTWGTLAMDIARLSANVGLEVLRIKNFINNNISGDIYDQSEARAIELLQDWTQGAVEDAGKLRAIFEQEEKAQKRYARSELDNIGSAKSKDYQAILQIRLNATVDDLNKIQKDLDLHFNAHANIFYSQYLEPAIQFRKEISSRIEEPKSSSVLEAEMYAASRVIDSNVVSLLKDLMRRNEIYTNKMRVLKNRLAEFDIGRKTIVDLAVAGSLPDNPFINIDKALSGDDYFDTEYEGWLANDPFEENALSVTNQAYNVGVENRFKASHSLLTDLLSDDAHPQYLLKDGGTITGNIFVNDGITIDGVDLDTHKHDGTDGSALIPGTSIDSGTLTVDAVDLNDSPTGVNDLCLVKYNTAITINGDTVYEAIICWEGEENVQYELQLHRISDVVEEGVWSPLSLNSLVWYDASDEDSITQTNGSVSQIDDKSGNDYHLIQSLGAAYRPNTGVRTLNDLNVLEFDNYSGQYLENTEVPTHTDSYVMFAVYEVNSVPKGVFTDIETAEFELDNEYGNDAVGDENPDYPPTHVGAQPYELWANRLILKTNGVGPGTISLSGTYKYEVAYNSIIIIRVAVKGNSFPTQATPPNAVPFGFDITYGGVTPTLISADSENGTFFAGQIVYIYAIFERDLPGPPGTYNFTIEPDSSSSGYTLAEYACQVTQLINVEQVIPQGYGDASTLNETSNNVPYSDGSSGGDTKVRFDYNTTTLEPSSIIVANGACGYQGSQGWAVASQLSSEGSTPSYRAHIYAEGIWGLRSQYAQIYVNVSTGSLIAHGQTFFVDEDYDSWNKRVYYDDPASTTSPATAARWRRKAEIEGVFAQANGLGVGADNYGAAGTEITTSHTIVDGQNRVIVAFISAENSAATYIPSISSLSYGGVEMTEFASLTHDSSLRGDFYHKAFILLEKDFPVGTTHTVTSTHSVSPPNGMRIHIQQYDNVVQAVPTGDDVVSQLFVSGVEESLTVADFQLPGDLVLFSGCANVEDSDPGSSNYKYFIHDGAFRKLYEGFTPSTPVGLTQYTFCLTALHSGDSSLIMKNHNQEALAMFAVRLQSIGNLTYNVFSSANSQAYAYTATSANSGNGSGNSDSTDLVNNINNTSLHINGVEFAGTTRDDVYNAIGNKAVVVRLGFQAASEIYDGIRLGYLGSEASFNYGMKMAEMFIVASPSEQDIVTAENYLGNKWGIGEAVTVGTISLEALTVSVSPSDSMDVLPFVPFAWYDPSDTSTITESDGSISQISDKSGNGYHLTQDTTSLQPKTGTATINGLNVIEFDGADTSQNLLNMSVPLSGTSYTQFAVYNINASDTTFILTNFAQISTYAYVGQSGSTSTTLVGNVSGASLYLNGVQFTGTRRDDVYNAVPNSPVIARSTFTVTNGIDRFQLGYNNGNVFAFGYGTTIGEVFLVESPTAQEIADIENYLADKWGITI